MYCSSADDKHRGNGDAIRRAKIAALLKLLTAASCQSGLVFCNRAEDAEELVRRLGESGVLATIQGG